MSNRRWTLAVAAVAVAVAASCSSTNASTASSTSGSVPAVGTSASGAGGSSAPSTGNDMMTTLKGLGLQTDDAGAGYTFSMYPGGDQVKGQVSLDVCGARFKSEAQRAARYQVGIRGADKKSVVSTEALMYTDAAAAAGAMSELQSAVASCPTTPTKGPVAGSPARSYTVNPAPDADWKAVDGVDRVAFDLTANDSSGAGQRMEGIFLRRGRLLLAIYLQHPDAVAAALAGHESPEMLTDRFATAIAQLPADAVA